MKYKDLTMIEKAIYENCYDRLANGFGRECVNRKGLTEERFEEILKLVMEDLIKELLEKKTVKKQIYDYVIKCNGKNDTVDGFFHFLPTETIVKWFVEGYFSGLADMLKPYNVGEKGKAIAKYYEEYCR